MEYRIVEGMDSIRTEDVVRLLKMTYWADRRSAETVETSMRNSLCYGIRADGQENLAGFARVITDYATGTGAGKSPGVAYRVVAGAVGAPRSPADEGRPRPVPAVRL